jgi:UDP-glucose 4-epimerase
VKIAVIGSSGFIGSNLVNRLLARDFDITCIDDFSRGKVSHFKGNNFTLKQGTILDPAFLLNSLAGHDIVIHLAAINGTHNFYERPYDVFQVSAEGTLNVIRACEKNKIKTLIYASSAEVYGDPEELPTSENYSPRVNLSYNSRFSYGGGKLVGELMMNYMARHLIERPIVFRPHNVYGPNMGDGHVIPQIIEKIIKGQNSSQGSSLTLEIQGDGTQTRSFAYIDDIVNGIEIIINNGKSNELYHIGNDFEISILDLCEMISELMNVKIEFKHVELLAHSPQRRIPSIDKMKELGYVPQFSLKDGLSETLKWHIRR